MTCMTFDTYGIMSIKVPSTINIPRSFPSGSDISDKVSATALSAHASKHIMIVKYKKIPYSFIYTDLTFQMKLEKKPFSPPMSPLTPLLPLNTP